MNSKIILLGFQRRSHTYTANGAVEMIKEIVANTKSDDLEILFQMDSGYFDEEIIQIIETIELNTRLNTCDKERGFVISRVLKPENDRVQLSLLKGADHLYFSLLPIQIYHQKR